MRWKFFFTVLFCATLLISQSVKAQDDDDSVTNTDEINNDDYEVDTDVVEAVDTEPEPDAEEVISDDIVPDEEVKEEEEEVVAEAESLEEVDEAVVVSGNSDVIVSRMMPNEQPSSRSGNYADGLWLDNLDIGGNDANYNWGKFFFHESFKLVNELSQNFAYNLGENWGIIF